MNVVRISDKLFQDCSNPAGQLMTSFSPFIRKTSTDMRKALANTLEISMPTDVNWADPGLSFAKVMIAAVESQEEPGRAKSTFALERISVMADDVGDIAMESVWNGQSECPELAGVQDRAIWMFINRNDIFRHAEEVRFIDSRRQTSRWSGFVIESDLAVAQSEAAIDAFIDFLKDKVSTGMVQVDVFERTRSGFDGSEYKVWQVTVYCEQKTQVSLEFIDAKITGVPRRPVLAAALTYEPLSGAIEVAANNKAIREAIIAGFLKNLLPSDTPIKRRQLRRYDLQGLKRRHDFPTDPEDLIEGVMLRSLRLMPLGGEDQRLTIELGRKSRRTIWEIANEQFAERNPLQSGWLVTSAFLAVTFQAMGDAKRGKTISVMITQPNGCDLKDRTELEQLIGNKYLRRWGILSDEPELLER